MKKNKLKQIVESIVGNINEKLQDGGAEMYDDGTGVFGGQKMSLGMRDELDYDKNEMEKALSKQFHTPENYQPRIQPEIGRMYKSHDDTVKVTNIDDKGYIHLIMSPNPTFAEKYGIPEFNKPIPLTWSQKQFDTLITESKKINVNSIVENITKKILKEFHYDNPSVGEGYDEPDDSEYVEAFIKDTIITLSDILTDLQRLREKNINFNQREVNEFNKLESVIRSFLHNMNKPY